MKTQIIEEDGVFLVCDHIGTLVLEDEDDPECQIYKIAYDENPNHLPVLLIVQGDSLPLVKPN